MFNELVNGSNNKKIQNLLNFKILKFSCDILEYEIAIKYIENHYKNQSLSGFLLFNYSIRFLICSNVNCNSSGDDFYLSFINGF